MTVPTGMSTARAATSSRRERVRQLTAVGGLFASEIARAVGVSRRTVQRYQAEFRRRGELPR